MAVPTHVRVVWRGHFLNSEEGWSFSAKFSRDNPAGQDAGYGDIHIDQMATAFETFIAGPHIGAHVIADDVRAYIIGTDGRMEGNGPVKHDWAPNATKGTGQSWQYPGQVSLAITTVAPNRGAAKLGRLYLPGPSRTIGSDGRLSSADATDYCTRVAQLLKDTSDAIDLELTQSSEGLNISPGPAGSSTGTRQTIDHIECGRVLDTLRTRRNQMLEERVAGGHIDW